MNYRNTITEQVQILLKTSDTLIRIFKDLKFKWKFGYGFNNGNENFTENDEDYESTNDGDE